MRKYKRFGLLLALSMLAAVPVMAQSTSGSTTSTEDMLKLELMAQVNRTYLLAPSVPSVEETIDIDDADEVNVVFGSPCKTLKIELISPSGQRFSSDNANSAGVKSRIFPDPAAPDTKGTNYDITGTTSRGTVRALILQHAIIALYVLILLLTTSNIYTLALF